MAFRRISFVLAFRQIGLSLALLTVVAASRAMPVSAGEEPRSAKQSTIENSIGMKLVLIPAGEFQMGAPEGEVGARPDEQPARQVRITRPFYLGAFEVTQQEYQKVMGQNPSYFRADGQGSKKVKDLSTDRFPVEQVSYEQAVAFCKKLSELPQERAAGRVYRLPTEAEWQYACRAGTQTPFHYGPSLGSHQANMNGNFPYGDAARGAYLGRTAAVGSYKPNAFGLYDMHGNVAEVAADWYSRYYFKDAPPDDPKGPAKGADKVVLGGSWAADGNRCRSAFRRSNATSGAASYFGLRVATDGPSTDAAKRP